jgi:TonB family protein
MKYIIVYMIESSVCLMLFMTFYYFILRKDTHHERNRVFLLLSLIASFILPILEINFKGFVSPVNNNIIEVLLPSIIISPDKAGFTGKSFSDILAAIYIAGAVIASASLTASFISIIMMLFRNKSPKGRVVRFDSNKQSCFSAVGYIFISNSVSRADSERMISHEMNHIRKYHFIDLFIVAFACIIQWFNPAVYFLRRSLQTVHEYEADQECILNGEEIVSYQSLLTSAALGTRMPVMTNKFSDTSLLKNRIIMMTKKKTGSLSSMKILLALPLAILMFFAFSCKDNTPATNTVADKQANAISQTDTKESNAEDEIYAICEEMPVFQGGDQAMFKYISENVKYPDEAIKNETQGKVYIKFAIDKEGNVTQPSVQKGVDPLLDKAALDVISAMPKFTPGKQGGKPVAVWYTLPINFQLK